MRGYKLARLAVALLLGALAPLVWSGAAAAEVKELRVCADPFTLPYSNRQMEGFENRIAEVLAKDLGASLTYTWWPQRRGILRAMNAGACDIVIGVPKEYDPLLTTVPYYRSAYEIIYRKDGNLKVASLNDPILQSVKIGVQANSPAHIALGERGISENVVGYHVNYDEERSRPNQIIDDLASGKIDVAIAWGPLVGYFVKKQSVAMEMVPILENRPKLPFVYEFSVGVRRRAKELVPQLDAALARNQAEIRKILEDYGVPLVPEPAKVVEHPEGGGGHR